MGWRDGPVRPGQRHFITSGRSKAFTERVAVQGQRIGTQTFPCAFAWDFAVSELMIQTQLQGAEAGMGRSGFLQSEISDCGMEADWLELKAEPFFE